MAERIHLSNTCFISFKKNTSELIRNKVKETWFDYAKKELSERLGASGKSSEGSSASDAEKTGNQNEKESFKAAKTAAKNSSNIDTEKATKQNEKEGLDFAESTECSSASDTEKAGNQNKKEEDKAENVEAIVVLFFITESGDIVTKIMRLSIPLREILNGIEKTKRK